MELPYRRSLRPVVGAVLNALRDGRIVGSGTSIGRVLVPSLQHDPDAGKAWTSSSTWLTSRRAVSGSSSGSSSVGSGSLSSSGAMKIDSEIGMRVFTSNDVKEGPRAFIEKRTPNFTGQ